MQDEQKSAQSQQPLLQQQPNKRKKMTTRRDYRVQGAGVTQMVRDGVAATDELCEEMQMMRV